MPVCRSATTISTSCPETLFTSLEPFRQLQALVSPYIIVPITFPIDQVLVEIQKQVASGEQTAWLSCPCVHYSNGI